MSCNLLMPRYLCEELLVIGQTSVVSEHNDDKEICSADLIADKLFAANNGTFIGAFSSFSQLRQHCPVAEALLVFDSISNPLFPPKQ